MPKPDGSTHNEMLTSQNGSGTTTNGASEDIWTRRARKKREYRARRSEEARRAEQERDRARYREDPSKKHAYYERTKTSRAIRDAKPFVGVDGEGITLESGYHAYNMLRAGDTKIEPRAGDVRLRTTDCLEYLSSLSPDNIYVTFFFDYDVAKTLEDLSFSRLKYLIDKEGRKRKKGGGFWPVDYGEYSIDYLPRKEFKVRKRNGSWITIHDVGSFYQTSFIHALELWDVGTEEERTSIAEGKDLRAKFAQIDPEYIDRYNALECRLLAELMTKFRAACIEVGYVPKKWQGPGLLAEAMLEAHGIPATSEYECFADLGPESLYAFGQHAFYGGRFETSVVGYTTQAGQQWPATVQYDINSAYPYALQHVPCLVHGTWRRELGPRDVADDELSISFGTFRAKSERVMFYGYPVRKEDGSIHFPGSGKGWYWSFESRTAIHQSFIAYDSWIYEKHCDCKPFAFLEEVYNARKRMGKSGKGIVLKLAMNSVYGKMAQSIGDPKYSNPVWASFITAFTRTQIMEVIHTMPACQAGWCGKDVYMIATDAFFTRDYDPQTWQIETGSGLGEWDRSVFGSGLFIIQPGLYFDPDSREAKFKTRGVPRRMVVEHKDRFLAAYAAMRRTRRVSDGDVLLPMTLFIGIRQALHRNSLKLLGQFVPYKDPISGEIGRRTSFDWSTKRRPEPLPDMLDYGTGGQSPHITTLPYFGTENEKPNGRPVQTIPYSKDIGGLRKRELLRLMFADQPDWMQEP